MVNIWKSASYLLLGLLLPIFGGAYWLLAWLTLLLVALAEAIFKPNSEEVTVDPIFLRYSGLLLLGVILIRTFLFDIYLVPSNSMSPTLLPNDRIMVSKMACGWQTPTSLLEVPMLNIFYKLITNRDGKAKASIRNKGMETPSPSISRGDILVFHHPQNNQQVNVKRCIGIAGDTLEEVDQRGQNLIIPGRGMRIDFYASNLHFYQKIIEQHEEKTAFVKTPYLVVDGELLSHYTFAQDYYYLLGDQAEVSKDSRHWGLLPQSLLIGKTQRLFYSLHPSRNYWQSIGQKIDRPARSEIIPLSTLSSVPLAAPF